MVPSAVRQSPDATTGISPRPAAAATACPTAEYSVASRLQTSPSGKAAVTVWSNVGYVTLFFLAGILAIPTEIQNAARTDGANAWQRFRHITLPMLRPTLFFVLVTGIVSAAQVFDTVYALTGGGPQGRTDLVAHRIYAEAFGAAAVGRAAVMAVVLFVLLVGVTIVQHLYFRKRTTYDVV